MSSSVQPYLEITELSAGEVYEEGVITFRSKTDMATIRKVGERELETRFYSLQTDGREVKSVVLRDSKRENIDDNQFSFLNRYLKGVEL